MPVDVNLGIDMPYNVRLREKNRLLENMDVITHNPQLLGGGRLREYALSGNTGAYPMDRDRLMELKAMGGAKLRKQGTAKALRTFGRAIKPLGKTINPLKKALVEEAIGEIQYGGRANKVKKQGVAKALRTFGRAIKPLGKTINPLKKALVEEAIGEIKYGGEKPKRLVKGSPEAKAHMARIRAMRK
jgi:hypothetical protein